MHRQKTFFRSFTLTALLCTAAATQTTMAAPVAIDRLSVNMATVNLTLAGFGNLGFSGPVAPSANVVMGTYQDPLITGNLGGLEGKAYTSNLFGKPAPTGTVDAALGTITVDFSSLLGQISGAALPAPITVELWPLSSPPVGTYMPATGGFSLSWSKLFYLGTIDVALSGSVKPVPLPAAVWLLVSGLVGLGVAARRRLTTG